MEGKERMIMEKSHSAGIEGSVEIDEEVMQGLDPSPYLKALGITLEQRVENLLLLAKASLRPNEPDAQNPQACYLPFILVQGPFVREAVFPIIVESSGEGESRAIAIRKAQDGCGQA